MKTMISVALAAVVFLGSQDAVASTGCTINGSAFSPLNEALQAFGDGNYAEILNIQDTYGTVEKAQVDVATEKLKTMFPSGFEECVTLSTKTRSARFRTHVVAYRADSGKTLYIALGLVKADDEWRVIHLTLGFELPDVLPFL